MAEFRSDPLGDGDANGKGKKGEIDQYYLDIRTLVSPSDIAPARIENSKIIFGGKGSGKTHLLLYIQNLGKHLERRPMYCVLAEPTVANKLEAYKGDLSADNTVLFWAELWRIAIDVAVLSHFLCLYPDKRATQAITRFMKTRPALPTSRVSADTTKTQEILIRFNEYILHHYPEISWKFTKPISPTEAFQYITNKFSYYASLSNDLMGALDTTNLEDDISALLHKYNTIHFLIDGLDEFAYSDPHGWSNVQHGLFKTVFLINRLRNFSQNLIVTVALRTYMYDVIARDPQFDRSTHYITKLRWDKTAARLFLTKSLQKVHGDNFALSDLLQGPRPLANWLGFESVIINGRKNAELVEDYFLRHTRLAPRHIVERFNALVAEQNRKHLNDSRLDENDFRRIISEGSSMYGQLILKTTVEEMMVQIPEIQIEVEKAILSGGSSETLLQFLIDELIELIIKCGCEIIDTEVFHNDLLSPFIQKILNGDATLNQTAIQKRVEDVMWRSGLIAYEKVLDTTRSWQFSWETGASSGANRASKFIGFHPTLIDVCNLEVSPHGPAY